MARWHEIPIVENPPLAQALYRAVEVGQAIPAKLYAAVAEILAFLYRAQVRAAAGDRQGITKWRMQPTNRKRLAEAAGRAEWIVPVAAVALVFVMLVPLPAFVLDLLLAISITASVLVLLSAMHILRPVQFSVFPSLLLLLTLFRLSLGLASSRRILLHGNEGAGAAGHVIEAFGQFVVGGNYVVGFVLFLALIAIQYMVVSHGAVRTAEVTARFTLDALPGKQMAIDADLNAGLIDEEAGPRAPRAGRAAKPSSMAPWMARRDSASAIRWRPILITAINIIAGFLIGVFQLDIPFREALKTYTILTVGDGLVTMIPSLLVSVAGGIVVTRASSDNSLGGDLGEQLFCAQPAAVDCRRRHGGAGPDSRAAQDSFLC